MTGLFSFEEVCERIGRSPGRSLEYVTVCNAVKQFLKNVDTYYDYLPPLHFRGKLINSVKQFRKLLVALKAAEPCSVNFWHRFIVVNAY